MEEKNVQQQALEVKYVKARIGRLFLALNTFASRKKKSSEPRYLLHSLMH